ncbi:MAG: GntR family transcriptional regulator [Pseudomonadota bacterium]
MPNDDTDQRAWLSVYNGLRREIEAGARAPGSDLPTIAALGRETGFKLHSARRVVERLCAEGYAQSWQGKGTRVAIQPLHIRMQHARPTFHELVAAADRKSDSQLLVANEGRLPARLAQRVQQKPGTEITRTETLRRVDGRVMALSVDYFLHEGLKAIAETVGETGSISRALTTHGVTTYRRDYTSFDARMPTAHEALLLEIPRSQPVYATLGANIDRKGDIFQLSTAVLRADCVRFEY